jgi:hypothetical protein
MRDGIGVVLAALLVIVVLYVVLGTFFRDGGNSTDPEATEAGEPPTGVKAAALADSIGPRPTAARAWYRYETKSPVRFWGSWAFLLLWGAFLTAAAEQFVAALIEAAIGCLILVYAYVRWRRGNRWEPEAPPEPPPGLPLPQPASKQSEGSDNFIVVPRTTDTGEPRSR